MNINGHTSSNEEFDDDSWSPPTEAEQKVIEARQERNNKISSLMGQYLLKGYKMLAITCPLCDCILLQDRQNQKYCIGCMEVDADTIKDNPAVNEDAARKTMEESQHRLPPMEINDGQEAKEIILPSSPCVPTSSLVETTPTLELAAATTNHLNTFAHYALEKPVENINKEQNLTWLSNNLKEIDDTLKILINKLSWASNKLRTTTNLHQCTHLVKLINEIITTVKNVEELRNR